MSSKKYLRPRLSSGEKAARFMRVVAKFMDFFVAGLLVLMLYPLGVFLGIAYLSFADGLQEGESLGKKLLGFKVVSLKDGKPCSWKAAAIRNLPFTVPMIFLVIPLWGWVISLSLLIPSVALELYFIYKLDSFHRLGDVMAETTVIANDPHREDLMKKSSLDWLDSDNQLAPQ